MRRGPPTRISVRVASANGGGIETVIVDDSPGERRPRSFDELEERARTLQGRVSVETSPDGEGTAVRVTLPPYTARNVRVPAAMKYLLFVSKPTGYELRERDGELPQVGA